MHPMTTEFEQVIKEMTFAIGEIQLIVFLYLSLWSEILDVISISLLPEKNVFPCLSVIFVCISFTMISCEMHSFQMHEIFLHHVKILH